MTNESDPIQRAHLTGRTAPTPPVAVYPAGPGLGDLVRRYWVPVWSLPEGDVWVQRVLQYPVCLIVVADNYARFYGPSTGLSTVELAGEGWAVGVMLQPAAGKMLWNRAVSDIADRFVDLAEVEAIDGRAIRDGVRAAMRSEPGSKTRHRLAIAVYEQALGPLLPVTRESQLLNTLVERVETDASITRVGQLAELAVMSERSLGRLASERLGVSPKWLIQRRRLHDAVEKLKAGPTTSRLTDLAADLGYTDQAHFTRDFKRVTGQTPGAYLADQA